MRDNLDAGEFVLCMDHDGEKIFANLYAVENQIRSWKSAIAGAHSALVQIGLCDIPSDVDAVRRFAEAFPHAPERPEQGWETARTVAEDYLPTRGGVEAGLLLLKTCYAKLEKAEALNNRAVAEIAQERDERRVG